MKLLKRRSGLPVRRLFGCGKIKLGLDLGDEPVVLRQAEEEVDAVGLAPGHEFFPREPAVGAQQNARPWPTGADLRDDARHLFDRAGRSVHIRAPQLGDQQMAAAEHVKRQIAVAVVIAAEEPPLLLAVQRIIGRVKIKNDLLRRAFVRLQEQLDRKLLDGHRIVADLVIARGLQFAQLQPVQRRLAGNRRAILAPRLELARQHRHHRIMAQFVVVIEILVAERDPEHPLPDQGRDLVLDPFRTPLVVEARRKPIHHTDGSIRRAQKQRSGIRADRAAVERRHHFASFNRCKSKQICATLCRHRGAPRID